MAETYIIAHRGASYEAPENTLSSFKLAFEQGADSIECDIHLSIDNEIMVIHDPTTTRTTGLDKIVANSLCSELKMLDAGSWKGAKYIDERIPTLEEVLEILPSDKKIFIEIKQGKDMPKYLYELLKQTNIAVHQFALMDFNLNTVISLRNTFPEAEVLWLYEFPPSFDRDGKRKTLDKIKQIASEEGFSGISTQDIPELDMDFINGCKIERLKCYCWTVDNYKRAKYLFESGISGVTTNKPGWMRKKLGG